VVLAWILAPPAPPLSPSAIHAPPPARWPAPVVAPRAAPRLALASVFVSGVGLRRAVSFTAACARPWVHHDQKPNRPCLET
jgi:hypothetical protein